MRPLLLIATLALPALAFAQGALTPPGAPAPTMKSLDQVEPRTTIGVIGGSSNSITISSPGSYVLMGNVTVTEGTGIWISSSNVTVDLNGFTISSTSATPSSHGIYLANNISQIRVGNGHIRGTGSITAGVYSGSGFNHGVRSYYANTRQVVLHDLTVEGVSGDGICVADNQGVTDCVVERCSVRTCGQRGIVAAIVRDSRADDCNWSAIIATDQAVRCFGRKVHPSFANNCIDTKQAVDCIGISTIGDAIYASESATSCVGTSTSSPGVHSGGIAINCRGTSSTHYGVQAIETAENCTGISDTFVGLSALCASNCRGKTTSGSHGLTATKTATGCVGENPKAGGVALSANIAIGCTAVSGSISTSYRYNMP